LDWSSSDTLRFGAGQTGVEGVNYVETTATDYASALTVANGQLAGSANFVAVQIGGDVVVFADATLSATGGPPMR
jgi:hypothetical protein